MTSEKRLIDMEDALRRMENAEHLMHSINGIKAVDVGALRQFFGMLKPVDAVEVVHGEWEKYTDDRFMGYGADGRIRYRKVYSYKCSKCWNYTAVKHNYCPNCGAKMDGDGNG